MSAKVDVAFKVAVLLSLVGLAYAEYRVHDEMTSIAFKLDQASLTSRHQQLKIWDKVNVGARVPTEADCGPLWPTASANPAQCEAFIVRKNGYIP